MPDDPHGLPETLLAAFEAAAGSARTAVGKVRVLQKHLSDEILNDTGLAIGTIVSPKLSHVELLERFRHVWIRDRTGPDRTPMLPCAKRLADEAVNVIIAIGVRLPAGRVRSSGAEGRGRHRQGRVCRLCWRTDWVWAKSHEMYSFCHKHRALPALPKRSEGSKCQSFIAGIDEERRAINEVCRAIAFSQRVLATASPDAVVKIVATPTKAFLQPKRFRGPSRPPDLLTECWEVWLGSNFPNTKLYLEALDLRDVFADPLSTLRALESRELNPAEVEEAENGWNWLPPLARCEAWQIIIQRGR